MRLLATLGRREQRTVVAGLVVLGVAVLCLRVAPAWWTWTQASRREAAIAAMDLDEARQSVSALSAKHDSLVALNGRYLALAPSILTGRNHGLVGAALASVVSGCAAGAGLELGAITIRPDTGRLAVFGRPSVRGDARGDVAGLTRFLVALERGPLTLALRQLSISQPEPAAPSDRQETLRIEFVIEGVALLDETVDSLRVTAVPGDVARRPTDRRP